MSYVFYATSHVTLI